MWHGSSDWEGDRWVIIAYSLPDLPEGVLDGLGFPSGLAASGCVQQGILPTPCAPTSLTLPDSAVFFLDICSGRNAPLCQAARDAGIPLIRIDLLVDAGHDLLDVVFFERLMRLCFSGRIRMAHASPPCCEYSRLKLRPGGPAPCRTPEFLQGLPGNDAQA